MLKTALVIIVLVAVVHSGLAAERLASCCTRVSKQKITEPILGYLVQRPDPPCVLAIIFQTKSGFYCSQLTAPWVHRKVVAFEEAKARTAALAVIPPFPVTTFTASPVSPSTLLPSPSISTMPAGETFSERDNK
ncbi:uncharacterized protein LOC144458889 [Epinephelus lanceolatus]